MTPVIEKLESDIRFSADQIRSVQHLFSALFRYNNDFIHPYLLAASYLGRIEMSGLINGTEKSTSADFFDLVRFGYDLWGRGFCSSLSAWGGYVNNAIEQVSTDAGPTWPTFGGDFPLKAFLSRQSEMLRHVDKTLPDAVREIEPEYGFHFERQDNRLVDETDRFFLYQILPTDPGVKIEKDTKPVLIIPPFVLGSNILSFLPGENKSYAHSYANQGIPTYIRIMKDIAVTPAFQVMTMEEETLDTRFFCETIVKRHGRKVTLNGYCQGGYSAVCQILTGKLDSVADALITCVAPMDGTRSKGLGEYLKNLPARYNNLLFGTKILPNGNPVADGQLMGWVYKLKSIADQVPLVSFFRDMAIADRMIRKTGEIKKTAAALNFWLKNERTDIPLAITKMSFESYKTPVTDDGTLPVQIFGKPLNFKRIEEKQIPWLLCYGEDDDLVEKETALAPADFIEIETVPFPKGHVAIATSWSHPESEFALHKRFGPENRFRGPVRFQLDLNQALDDAVSAKKKTAQKKTAKKKPVRKKTSEKTPSKTPKTIKTKAKKTDEVKPVSKTAKAQTASKKPVAEKKGKSSAAHPARSQTQKKASVKKSAAKSGKAESPKPVRPRSEKTVPSAPAKKPRKAKT